MSYINFRVLDKFLKDFCFNDFLYICAIKQQDEENQKEYYNISSYTILLEQGYIKTLKNGALRLDKKGTEFLKNVSKSDEITEDTEKIVDWMVKIYKDREDGIVKNKQECKRRAQWFQDETGIYQNKLALLISSFMQDTYSKYSGLSIEEFKAQNPRMVLNNMLDNVFYKQDSMFDKHYTLNKSPLYQYFEDNQEYIEEIWKKNNLE